MYKKVTIFTFILVFIDQIVKILLNNSIKLYDSIVIIKNFFSITLVHNNGAAFSILENNKILLIGIAIAALFLIIIFFIKDKKLNNSDIVIYSMLMGGIVGNLIDRVVYGYVIDYLDFKIINYNFPIFNFADILIVVSIMLLFIFSIKEEVCKK